MKNLSRHVMTADCRDDKDIKKRFRRKNSVVNMLVRKLSFAPMEAKIKFFRGCIVNPFMDVLFGVIHTRTLLENLLTVIVTHSNVFIHPQIHQLESSICDERN